MLKKSAAESGALNPRIFIAFLLCSAAAWFAVMSFATPSPASGTISRTSGPITYTDPTGAPPNASHLAFGKPQCGPSDAACSVFTLHVDPSITTATGDYNPANYQLLVQWSWAVNTVDFDVFVEDANNNLIGKNTSTSDPSSIVIPASGALSTYKLIAILSTGAPIPYTTTVSLQPAGPSAGCNPAVTNCAPPRYENYPAGPSQANGAGEPSLGVDWNPNIATLKHDKVNTGGVAFFTANRTEWRVNFDDCSSPAINLWEDVSAITTQEFVLTDPIGFVDHYSTLELGRSYPPPHTSGRVFSLELIGGQGNSLASYSDNDGNSYLPGGNGGPGAGPDHETLGGGPFSATQTVPIQHPNYANAIYYCSQNSAAEAQCSRSDDGGQTFGPGVLIYTPSQCTGGIHGHVKVARDGTVYVPSSSCGTVGTAGAAVSTDNGLTWTENNVPDSTSSQDPSVGIGQNDLGKPGGQTTNTIYLGYVDGDGKAKVAVSGNRGATYSTPVDVGAPFGVTHAVFPVVVAGDDNRAAFAFIGTGAPISTNANPCNVYGATLNCKNIWHLYIATTYDRGANWITVDATPNDPAQQGVVCLEGTTCLGGRNLLDFNDFAIDSQGRGLVGWADGCVNCANTFGGQSSGAHGTVTRQSGGRRLFAFFDPQEPAAPAAPQILTAVRVPGPPAGVLVSWLKPDNGGSPIIGYNVYRSTTSNTETFLGSVTGEDTNKFLDQTANSATEYFYRVTAVNQVAEGSYCREVSINGTVETATSCAPPYIKVQDAAPAATDPTGQFSIQRVNMGEPFVNCSTKQLTAVLKVNTMDPGGTGVAAPPPVSTWEVYFKIPGSANSTGQPQTLFVEYDNTTLPEGEFLTGWVDPATGGDCSALFLPGDPANPITGTVAPDGTFTMNLNFSNGITYGTCDATAGSDMTVGAGQWTAGMQLTSIQGKTYQRAGGIISGAKITKAQTTGDGTYTTVGNVKGCNTVNPVAVLSAMPQAGPPPLNVTFDGSGSNVPAGGCGTIASYTLNFGDGSPAVTQSTPTFMHTYAAQGNYPAQLTVTSSFGQVSANPAQVIIAVGNQPPIADLRATPTAGNPPLIVHFDATHSSDPDFSDTITTYTYRFGDGTADLVTGAPLVDHTYTTTGTFAARLVVTDSRGAESVNTAEQIITVTGAGTPTPTATATAAPSASASPSATATATATANPTATATATPTASATASPTASATATASPTASATATASPIATATATASPTATATATANPTATATATANPTATATATATASPIATATATASPIATPTATASPIATATATASPIATPTASATATASAAPTATATATASSSASPTATPTSTATPTATATATPTNVQLVNISGRVFTQTGDNVGIGGFIISGSTSKRIMARAIGPSMKVNGTPVQGRLTDPVLELHDAKGSPSLFNDNWRTSQETEINQTGLAPSDDKESAIVKRLDPGAYTAIIKNADGSPGIGLVELYDLSSTEAGELGNLAVRALVKTGDNVLIDGLILQGGTPKRVLFRALGPSVKVNGNTVPGALADPAMDVYDANGNLLRANDNWGDAPNKSEIEATGLAPQDSHESAVLLLLQPGNYTSVVHGVGGTTGISLSETYKLNN